MFLPRVFGIFLGLFSFMVIAASPCRARGPAEDFAAGLRLEGPAGMREQRAPTGRWEMALSSEAEAGTEARSAAAMSPGVPDGLGGMVVVWSDRRNASAGSSYTPITLYVQRVNAAGVPQWTANGVVVCNAVEAQASPALVSDGAGGAIITWTDFRNGFGNSDIYAQRVNAAGVPLWTTNGVVVCNAVNDQGNPTLVSDGAGGAIVAWNDYRDGASFDLYAQRVNASGTPQWTANGVVVCNTANTQTMNPASVSDGAAGAIITWRDYRSGNFDIYAQRVNASGTPLWTTNGVVVCNAVGGQGGPTLVSDGAGGAVINWTDFRNSNYDIYAQRVNASGTPLWTTNGVVVCTAVNYRSLSGITSDGAGGAISSWEDFRNGNFDIYAQRVNASGTPLWAANGVVVCNAQNYQVGPTLVSDGAGGAIIAWTDNRFGGYYYDIYAQRVNASGTPLWAANGVYVCVADDTQSEQVLAPDGAGGAIVAWEDRRSGLDLDDIYAQRVNASGTPLWAANGVAVHISPGVQLEPVCVSESGGSTITAWAEKRGGYYDILTSKVDATGVRQWAVVVAASLGLGSQVHPAIVSDGAGGAIVAWENRHSGVGSSDIYAQRVNASGTPLWTANGVVVCQVIYDEVLPAIATDGAGGAIITWQDRRGWSNTDIYAQRVNASGTPLWTANGVVVCNAVNDQFYPALVSDGAGGAIIVWIDRRNSIGNDDIYAQRVNAAGTPLWTSNGVVVCQAIYNQVLPEITSDGAGGAVITWEDWRNSNDNSDIYAQRVSAAGVPLWTTNGVVVCNAVNDQGNPTLVSDGAGGAIITWESYGCFCVGPYDIYAQRVNAAGVPQWTANGVVVCNAVNDQVNPALVSDGAGGAIITWEDFRAGTSSWVDIYAQRLSSAGAPQWTANGVVVCIAPLNQGSPAIAADGASGAVLVWEDSRGGNGFYLYKQRLNATGAAQWPDGALTTGVPSFGGALVRVTTLMAVPTVALHGSSIRYALPSQELVHLTILDAMGRVVRGLFDGVQPAGPREIFWDGRDDGARVVAPGVYFVGLEAGTVRGSCRVIMLR